MFFFMGIMSYCEVEFRSASLFFFFFFQLVPFFTRVGRERCGSFSVGAFLVLRLIAMPTKMDFGSGRDPSYPSHPVVCLLPVRHNRPNSSESISQLTYRSKMYPPSFFFHPQVVQKLTSKRTPNYSFPFYDGADKVSKESHSLLFRFHRRFLVNFNCLFFFKKHHLCQTFCPMLASKYEHVFYSLRG